MAPLLRAVVFLSGASALIFQTLWFRQAGLVFGNSVWASSVVLASFMAGLALGNALAATRARDVRAPLRIYGRLELLIAATGLGLVLLFPALAGSLAPLLAHVAHTPSLRHGLHVVIAFGLMLVPATAMGATLPLLVKAVARNDAQFGPALGRLYGWNTLGAVAGALGSEGLLVEVLGVRGTGVAAALFDLLAASLAFGLARRLGPSDDPSSGLGDLPAASPRRIAGLLGVAAVSGGILLGLEVVWFRFLQLFVAGTSLAFALMLAVVLLGIGTGGLLGGAWLSRSSRAPAWLPALALANGVLTLTGYLSLDSALDALRVTFTIAPRQIAFLSLWLMFPTSVVSGLLFPLLGRALKERCEGAALTAGLLTLANTAGAALGALAAGFLLLPSLGIESSLVVLSVAYGAVAVLFVASGPPLPSYRPVQRYVLGVSLLFFVGFVGLFPFGFMQRAYFSRVAERRSNLSRLVAVREGLTETLLYLQRDLLEEPLAHYLVTNGMAMSGTGFYAERYMKGFVYWALAVHPQPRRALMISYGVGSTAKALTESRTFESMTFVDISVDVLQTGCFVFTTPGTCPLEDPRVRVQVEDGRHFLLTSRESFDLITGEPPPPKAAGIVNLYSQEYFALMRERLAPGGVVTYWLPVYQIEARSALAIVRAFCNAFEDCSLWGGTGYDWMLAGTRDARGNTEERFSQPWRDPVLGPSLRSIGLETPAHLGALFLGDAAYLRKLAAGVEPLVDDFPSRLSRNMPTAASFAFYRSLTLAADARLRFEQSPYIRRVWPPSLIGPTLAQFEAVGMLNEQALASLEGSPRAPFPSLHRALTRTSSYILPLAIAGSSEKEQAIVDRAVARGVSNSLVDYLLGVRALAHRDYPAAARLFQSVEAREPSFGQIRDFRALAACLGGDEALAIQLLAGRGEGGEGAFRLDRGRCPPPS